MSTGSGTAATILVVVCRAANMVFVSCVSGGDWDLGLSLSFLKRRVKKLLLGILLSNAGTLTEQSGCRG